MTWEVEQDTDALISFIELDPAKRWIALVEKDPDTKAIQIRIKDFETGKQAQQISINNLRGPEVTSYDLKPKFSASGKYFALHLDDDPCGTVGIWRTDDWEQIDFENWAPGSDQLVISPDERVAYLYSHERIKRVNLETGEGEELFRFEEGRSPEFGSLSSSGNLISWTVYNSLYILNLSSKAAPVEIEVEDIRLGFTASFSNDDHMLAVGHKANRETWIVSTEDGRVEHKFPGIAPKSGAWSGDSLRLQTKGKDEGLALWNISDGGKKLDLPIPNTVVDKVSGRFLNNETFLVEIGPLAPSLTIIDLQTDKRHQIKSRGEISIEHKAMLLYDSNWLVVQREGAPGKGWLPHDGIIYAIHVSRDFTDIVSIGEDDMLRRWHRRRPEWWWGAAWLPEFWLSVVFGIALVWSLVRDFRTLRRATA